MLPVSTGNFVFARPWQLIGNRALYYLSGEIYCQSEVLLYPIIRISYPAGQMLRTKRSMCSNCNAQAAAAETKKELLLQMKTALFTNLQYFFPLVKGSVRVLAPSKATKLQTGRQPEAH